MYLVRSTCRSCESTELDVIYSAGEIPIAGSLLLPSELEEPEPLSEADLVFCRGCSLVQLRQTVSPARLYGDGYMSLRSSSEGRRAHYHAGAERLVRERRLDGNSLVIEIGCNEGAMLQAFQARGIATLGIEPAPFPASEARRAGIAILQEFFSRDLAVRLAGEGHRADVVVVNNVLHRAPDLHGFLSGVRSLLKDEGVAVIETPYLRDAIDAAAFDLVHHGVLALFSVTSLERLLVDAGLSLNRVERHQQDGGLLRCWAGRTGISGRTVQVLREDEAWIGLHKSDFYESFSARAASVKRRVLALLDELKADGARIAGYGADASAVAFLTSCGIGEDYLDFVADHNVYKQGRFLPGSHLPVLSPERLRTNGIDAVLLLAWRQRDEVLRQQDSFRRRGGRFLVPLPEPVIV